MKTPFLKVHTEIEHRIDVLDRSLARAQFVIVALLIVVGILVFALIVVGARTGKGPL